MIVYLDAIDGYIQIDMTPILEEYLQKIKCVSTVEKQRFHGSNYITIRRCGEMADAHVSKTCLERGVGSTPSTGTNNKGIHDN